MATMAITRPAPADGGLVDSGPAKIRRRRSGQDLVDGRLVLQGLVPRVTRMLSRYTEFQSGLLRQGDLLTQFGANQSFPLKVRVDVRQRLGQLNNYLANGAHWLNNLNSVAADIYAELQRMQNWGPLDAVHAGGTSFVRHFPRRVQALEAQLERYVQRSMLMGERQLRDAYCRYGSGVGRQPPRGGGGGSAGSSFGVQAAEAGVPEGLTNDRLAYEASWASQARLFQVGRPVGGDIHRRVHVFKDQSYVLMQAHTPRLTYSDASQAALVLAALCGAVAGAIIGGPAGAAAAGALAGTVTGGVAVRSSRPCDAAWQLYTFRYYESAAATRPRFSSRFYGWLRSPSIREPVALDGERNPARFVNFADQPQDFSWWTCRTGDAEVRTPEVRRLVGEHGEAPLSASWLSQLERQLPAASAAPAPCVGAAASPRPMVGDALVQNMAAFETATARVDPWSRVRAGDLAPPLLGGVR